MYLGHRLVTEGRVISVVVDPSAREAFIPRELAAAYKEFLKRGPQHQDAETGHSVSAYRFGERVLLVYEEYEAGVVVLIHPSAWKWNSANFVLTEFSEVHCRRAFKYPAFE